MRLDVAHMSGGGIVNRALIAFGVACLLIYALALSQTAMYQRKAKAEIDERISAHGLDAPSLASNNIPYAARSLVEGELIGRVDIPRLKLSAAVAEGDDNATLGKAVGHLPDTPLPWQRRGNVGLAAHRDGLFRGLKNIRVDDEVRVVTPRGEYFYRVRKTRIVNPEDVWVLAPTPTPTVTLITCYPFSYVGHAPQRFIVQAELVGGVEGSVVKGAVLQ
jgi:LPXTG-site transpeptidase (sortase) family protein